jgi:phage terminase large subunit GpA-like protein
LTSGGNHAKIIYMVDDSKNNDSSTNPQQVDENVPDVGLQPQLATAELTDTCQCGRLAWKVHCPMCGSTDCYAFSISRRFDRVTRPNGQVMRLGCYRCRKCVHQFNDDDWKLRCVAPSQRSGRQPSVELTKRQQQQVKIQDDLSSIDGIQDQMLEALEKIKKKREREGRPL